jgi:putative transposase
MKKRFSEEQIIGFLREAEAGLSVKDLWRRLGFSEASYYLWKSKFGGMSVPDVPFGSEKETSASAPRVAGSGKHLFNGSCSVQRQEYLDTYARHGSQRNQEESLTRAFKLAANHSLKADVPDGLRL